MAREERLKLIQDLEKKRNSKIITYVTGDRKNLQANISSDAVRLIYEHLIILKKEHGVIPKIDLFIYSLGGHSDAPWKIIPMIREFCDELNVLIPYKAYSAATLIALGADKIIMGRKGELSPVDISLTSPFHPENPYNAKKPQEIGVEDITSFISLIKDKVGLTDQKEIASSFNILVDKVGPLALGNLNRFHSHNRLLIEKLLKTHNKKPSEDKIRHIVSNLTEKIFFHGHSINRMEARDDIELDVEFASDEVENLMWLIYLEYEKDLKLDEPFEPEGLLDQNKVEEHIEKEIQIAFVESAVKVHVFKCDYSIKRNRNMPVNLHLNINVGLPPNIDPKTIPQTFLDQIKNQIKDSIVEQITKQCPVVGINVKSIGSGWKEE